MASDDGKVVGRAAEFLRLMAPLTPPDALAFRSYATDGVEGLSDLCAAASHVATGSSDDALASLVISPGEQSSFTIEGAHARATLRTCPTPHTRLVVLVLLLVAALVIFLLLRRR